jgi:hypothetical protein
MTTTNRRETVTIHGRDFQRWSVDQKIYLVPVDDVSLPYLNSSTIVLVNNADVSENN